MSQFPIALDTDVDLPRVDDNLTEIGGFAINNIRSAIFAVEREMGLGASGSSGSIADRIGVSLNANGTLKSAAIFAAGALTGPLNDGDVASNAGIAETKLNLAYSTQTLFNQISALDSTIDNLVSLFTFLNTDLGKHVTGVAPLHGGGSGRHNISHIDSTSALLDASGAARPLRLDGILTSLNTDLVNHENAGKVSNDPVSVAHVAAGISVATSGFTTIPAATDNLQKFVDYVDQTSFAGLKKHEQNNHTNGIPRTFRSSLISTTDGSNQGQNVVGATRVYTYLGASGAGVVDSITNGDDIIEFDPVTNVDNIFDASFALVKAGDVITVDYGTSVSSFVISEVLSTSDSANPPNKTFLVRVNGRNVENIIRPSSAAHARIDRASFNESTDNILAPAASNNDFGAIGSMIIGNPRGAMAMGLGFAPERFDATHYKLYLQLYPNGTTTKVVSLPAIDVTGNAGATPGAYTLESIVAATNEVFRAKGFNFRFIAFSHRGEFGIALSDSINNVSFSIISGNVDGSGTLTQTSYPNNVVGLGVADPLGFGFTKANVASPPFTVSYPSVIQTKFPTIIFTPLKNKTAYINGNGIDTLASVSDGTADAAGIHFWPATITDSHIIANSTVQVTYTVPLDLSAYDLRPGKTIVCQPADPSTIGITTTPVVDYGRFTIQSVSFIDCPGQSGSTTITVRNAVHGSGLPVFPTSGITTPVHLYFSSDSVGFEAQNLGTSVPSAVYKRYFEVLVDQVGATVSHERARIRTDNIAATLAAFNLISVSPKLRGYTASNGRQITLRLTSFNQTTGIIAGYLCKSSALNVGPTVTGKIGERIRFFDESNVDYVDVVMNFGSVVNTIANADILIDLFPTLALDSEFMLLASCQVNDSNGNISNVVDRRSFGTLSERDFTDSAKSFIATGDRITQQNGIVRGFDSNGIVGSAFSVSGGVALVDGKFVELNEYTIAVPRLDQYTDSVTTNSKIFWAFCAESSGRYALVPLRDATSFIGSVNEDRIFTFKDPTSTFSYSVESSTFAELVDRKKNYTVIYTISSDNSNGTITVEDARKYVNDTNASAPIVIAQQTNQGNFKTTEAAITWLNHDSSNHGLVVLRGVTRITAPFTLASPNQVEFIADGASFAITASLTIGPKAIIRNTTFNIGTGGGILALDNVSFINCNFIGTSASTLLASGSSTGVTLENCKFSGTTGYGLALISCTDVRINGLDASGLVSSLNTLAFLGSSSITINDSKFVNTTANVSISDGSKIHFKACTISGSSATDLSLFISNATSVNFSESTITGLALISGCTAVAFKESTLSGTNTIQGSTSITFDKTNLTTSSTTVPVMDLKVSSKIKFRDCNLTAAGPQIVLLETSDYTSFRDCDFVTGYNPVADSTYFPLKSVNASTGVIYTETSHTGTSIKNCRFLMNSSSSNHYSAIVSLLKNVNTVVDGFVIDGCKFTNAIFNNGRNLIAILNTVVGTSGELNGSQGALVNSRIENNVFDSNQSILISTVTDTGFFFVFPGLNVSNVVIKNNNCGVIGYVVSSPTKQTTIYVDSLIDRKSGLTISDNTCHFIASLDAAGTYRSAAQGSNNVIDYPSGFVTIEKNKCHWIHTLISSNSNSELRINNNYLSAFDPDYLTNFGAIYREAIHITASPTTLNVNGIGNDGMCIIDGNITDLAGPQEGNGYTTPYKYEGIISTYCSANITNNILRGVGAAKSIISAFGPKTSINGNKLYRDTTSINSYLNAAAGTTGIAEDNFFDKPTIDGTSEQTVSMPVTGWKCTSNKNQTEYVSVPWTEGKISFNRPDGSSNLIQDDGFQMFLPPTVGGYGGYVSDILYVVEKTSSASGIARGFGFTQNLNKYLPFGVSILNVHMNAAATSITSPLSDASTTVWGTTGNTVYMNLATRDSFLASDLNADHSPSIDYSTIDNNYHDSGVTKLYVGRNINTTDFFQDLDNGVFAPLADLTIDTAAWPANAPTDRSTPFIVNTTNSVMVTLDVYYKPKINAALWLSPVLVKFRW
jgi:hypothetical protein